MTSWLCPYYPPKRTRITRRQLLRMEKSTTGCCYRVMGSGSSARMWVQLPFWESLTEWRTMASTKGRRVGSAPHVRLRGASLRLARARSRVPCCRLNGLPPGHSLSQRVWLRLAGLRYRCTSYFPPPKSCPTVDLSEGLALTCRVRFMLGAESEEHWQIGYCCKESNEEGENSEIRSHDRRNNRISWVWEHEVNFPYLSYLNSITNNLLNVKKNSTLFPVSHNFEK